MIDSAWAYKFQEPLTHRLSSIVNDDRPCLHRAVVSRETPFQRDETARPFGSPPFPPLTASEEKLPPLAAGKEGLSSPNRFRCRILIRIFRIFPPFPNFFFLPALCSCKMFSASARPLLRSWEFPPVQTLFPTNQPIPHARPLLTSFLLPPQT